ncbi:hypothetical protein [Dietzia maris]|uniref:hypothetical protein n=2 Tax=Dietzia maris TaxID=37915 RepID=UPI001D0429BE
MEHQMTEPITTRDLANEIADTRGIYRGTALELVSTYLDQLAQDDDIDINHDDIPGRYVDEVHATVVNVVDGLRDSALRNLAGVRDQLATFDDLQKRRIDMVCGALVAGARVVDIAAASGLTRGRIYQIRDRFYQTRDGR